jgi:aromatic ring hydroxylase
MREDPSERVALRLVRETDAGVVISGKVGMHTSPVYAEDVYVGSHCGIDRGGHRATFVVPVNAPGATVLCRKISARHPNPFMAPLSSRYDELDAQMWLDDVFIPWERVFLMDVTPELYCWLSKAEFTLGLALACTHAVGLVEHEPTLEYLIDLIPEFTAEGQFSLAGSIALGEPEDVLREVVEHHLLGDRRDLVETHLAPEPLDVELLRVAVAAVGL